LEGSFRIPLPDNSGTLPDELFGIGPAYCRAIEGTTALETFPGSPDIAELTRLQILFAAGHYSIDYICIG
jgi:hypothetical protein